MDLVLLSSAFTMSSALLSTPQGFGGLQRKPTNHTPISICSRNRKTCRVVVANANNSNTSSVATSQETNESDDMAMSIQALHSYINLNRGTWNGSFFQFDTLGNLLQSVNTKLSVSSYGEEELVSLMQTLKIKQAPSKTSVSDTEDPEWEECKLRETNMFTVEKHQLIGFFPEEKVFSLRHQTTDMLDRVLRVGVLGEDDVDEESPMGLKVPPRRPSIVSESCIYSMDGNSRLRAFHVLNREGLLDMIGIFHETKEKEKNTLNSFDKHEGGDDRINGFLGRWTGRLVTKRSGLYGATITEADTDMLLQIDDKGKLIQEFSSTSGGGQKVQWTGTRHGSLISFDKGFQMTLLPGGMYLACPTNVANCVREIQSFFFEFCWMESPWKRRRIVRTFDVQGCVVSTTCISETKV